jgi:hypothetical protein
MEDVEYYRQKVARLRRGSMKEGGVSFSAGAGLEAVVKNASVAVTYCSTVFLDCLRWNVPVVSFSWHDFSYKKALEKYGVFYFAGDLEELRSLVYKGAAGGLKPYSESISPFLCNSAEDEIEGFFSQVVGCRDTAFTVAP